MNPASTHITNFLDQLVVCVQFREFVAPPNAEAIDEDIRDRLATRALSQKVLQLAAEGGRGWVVGVRDRLVE